MCAGKQAMPRHTASEFHLEVDETEPGLFYPLCLVITDTSVCLCLILIFLKHVLPISSLLLGAAPLHHTYECMRSTRDEMFLIRVFAPVFAAASCTVMAFLLLSAVNS